MSILSAPYLHDEEKAHNFVEAALWPNGPVCPHCGCTGRITKVKANPEKRIRVGLWRCGDCKKQFTVKVSTVFEDSKIKLHLWIQAIVLMTSSKKGISAHQLHRTLEVTYKTAWFMEHRIREAMRSGDLAPFGAGGGIVEVDETFIGKDPKWSRYPRKGGHQHEMKVPALVDRSTGRARAQVVDPSAQEGPDADPGAQHRPRGARHDRRCALLLRPWQDVRRTSGGDPQSWLGKFEQGR